MSAPTILVSGRCRICGCTQEKPCHDENGVPCTWMDREHTLCDNLECIGRVSLRELMVLEPPIAVIFDSLPNVEPTT